MEPVTHILTGACLARTGLNRRAAYTTLAMAVAAEFPDIDTLWGLRGPVSSFQHHRGITHTFIGIPVEAAVIVLAVAVLHTIRSRKAQAKLNQDALQLRARKPLTAAPVHWGLLYLFTVIALLSHIFLDFTNNYGVRPFFPCNPSWYAASITFIFDPLLFLLLLSAIVLPALFRLVGSEIGARRQPFAARGWAIAALSCIVALWTFRAVQHNRAVDLVSQQSLSLPGGEQQGVSPSYLKPQRILANPDPFNPFRWWTVTDFGPVYQLGVENTHTDTYIPAQQTQPKMPTSPAIQAAMSSKLGKAYLDWSPMPFITAQRKEAADTEPEDVPVGHTVVVFRDPRFMADIPGMHGRTPLQGVVELDAQNHVVRQTMDGKSEQ